MTNETLANLIKDGADELIPALWDQVEKFFYLKARQWYNYSPESCACAGIELQDLEQESYFAFLDALRAWDTAAVYNFLTYAGFPIRKRFNALLSRLTPAQKKKPLNNSKSLHQPIGEEDFTLTDTLEDEGATEDFLSLEGRLDQQRLHKVLDECLDRISPRNAEAIRLRYYEGLSTEEMGKKLGVKDYTAKQREVEGLRQLRRGKNAKALAPWRLDVMSSAFRGSGFKIWEATKTSSTEYAALKLIDLEESRKLF